MIAPGPASAGESTTNGLIRRGGSLYQLSYAQLLILATSVQSVPVTVGALKKLAIVNDSQLKAPRARHHENPTKHEESQCFVGFSHSPS